MITKQKHINELLGGGRAEIHYVKPMLSLCNSEDERQTLAGAISNIWPLFLYHCDFLH